MDHSISCKTQHNYVKFILHCEPVNQSENDSKLLLRIRMDCQGMHKINYRKQILVNQFLSKVWDVSMFPHRNISNAIFLHEFLNFGLKWREIGKILRFIWWLLNQNIFTRSKLFDFDRRNLSGQFSCEHDWKGLQWLKWCEMNKECVSRLN